jgi:predicted aspartyl protease
VPKTINCNPPIQAGTTPLVRLIEYGAVVPLTVRSSSGAERKLEALIDTGSQYTVIDEGMSQQLKLVPLRQEQIGTVSQSILLTIYHAEMEVPPLGIKEFGEVLGGMLAGGNHEALLGREQLPECRLDYDGPSGNVTLTR